MYRPARTGGAHRSAGLHAPPIDLPTESSPISQFKHQSIELKTKALPSYLSYKYESQVATKGRFLPHWLPWRARLRVPSARLMKRGWAIIGEQEEDQSAVWGFQQRLTGVCRRAMHPGAARICELGKVWSGQCMKQRVVKQARGVN